jgi:CRISPR-associated protein Cmr2
MKRPADVFACFPLQDLKDLDQLKRDLKSNPALQGRLLAAALSNDRLKEIARGDYRNLVHTRRHKTNPYEQQVIVPQLRLLQSLRLLEPDIGKVLPKLPAYSFFLRVSFLLSKPYISRDDDPFYIIDNPLKKEKVFGVPYVAATSWKGNLRWTTMHVRIARPLDDERRRLLESDGEWTADKQEQYEKSAVNHAEERFRHTLLFGSEQGWHEERPTGWTDYLDSLIGKCASDTYRELLRNHFGVRTDDPAPRVQGRLQFFPTYLDKIDLEVINPHDRETRTGKQPIYFEVAPAGAKGCFSLLYVPFDLIGDKDARRAAAQSDLEIVVAGVEAMLCEYGFSAKKSSGFGVADSASITGRLQINDPDWSNEPRDWNGFPRLLQMAREWLEVGQ